RFSWEPYDGIRFRGQFARAVRAPNIIELFGTGGENFATVTDRCNGVTATSTNHHIGAVGIDDVCRADPLIAARIAANGSFALSGTELQGTGGTTGIGNHDLTPEKSDSVTGGIVGSHDFGTWGRVEFSADYFAIKIKNEIHTITRQNMIDLCYTT